MTFLQAVLLGVVQGITEFLPVSSTAHLAVIPWLLGWSIPPEVEFAFDVLVQMGTLVAVIAYFWRDLVTLIGAALLSLRKRSLADPAARQAWLLALATIPAVIGGLLFKELVSGTLQQPMTIGLFLLLTGVFLFWTSRTPAYRTLDGLTARDAIWIGLGQLVALFPGASRSGWTTGVGLRRGLDRVSATRFAFLMAIPIMLGAGVVESVDVMQNPGLAASGAVILTGVIAAAVTGFAAIAGLLRFLRSRSLNLFAGYCMLAGCVLILIWMVRG